MYQLRGKIVAQNGTLKSHSVLTKRKNSHIEWYLKMSVCQLRGKIVPSKVEVYQLRGKMVTQDGTLTHSVLSEQKNSHTYTSFQKVWLNHNQYHFN